MKDLISRQAVIDKDTNVPSTDCISRQAAIEVLNKLARDNFTLNNAFAFYLGALHDAADGVKALPAAQPQRMSGRWIRHKDWVSEGYCEYTCSECDMGVDVMYNYCPRCGAQMDGGEQDGLSD